MQKSARSGLLSAKSIFPELRRSSMSGIERLRSLFVNSRANLSYDFRPQRHQVNWIISSPGIFCGIFDKPLPKSLPIAFAGSLMERDFNGQCCSLGDSVSSVRIVLIWELHASRSINGRLIYAIMNAGSG